MQSNLPLTQKNPDQFHVGGCAYDDNPRALRRASADWWKCAREVAHAAQEDTDWAYRLLGARAARYRRAVSRALLHRAIEQEA